MAPSRPMERDCVIRMGSPGSAWQAGAAGEEVFGSVGAWMYSGRTSYLRAASAPLALVRLQPRHLAGRKRNLWHRYVHVCTALHPACTSLYSALRNVCRAHAKYLSRVHVRYSVYVLYVLYVLAFSNKLFVFSSKYRPLHCAMHKIHVPLPLSKCWGVRTHLR